MKFFISSKLSCRYLKLSITGIPNSLPSASTAMNLPIVPLRLPLPSTQLINLASVSWKSLNLRNRGVRIISCPSCARQGFQVIETVKILEDKLAHIKTPITLSIIGCVVNGPGEAAMTDVGITGGKKGNNMLYLSGIQTGKVFTDDMINRVVNEVEKKASELENN